MSLRLIEKVPEFELPSTTGEIVTPSSLRGRKTVIYFYPKDQTPGCTLEARAFRDVYPQLAAAGAEIYGVSKDSIASHERFRVKERLTFPLLTDEDSRVARTFGAYGMKMMYGKEVEGTIRSTFILDEDGKLIARFSPVKVQGHAEEVLRVLSGEAPSTDAPSSMKRAAKPRATTKRATAKKAIAAPKKSRGAAKGTNKKVRAPARKLTKKASAKRSPAKAKARGTTKKASATQSPAKAKARGTMKKAARTVRHTAKKVASAVRATGRKASVTVRRGVKKAAATKRTVAAKQARTKR